MFGGGHTGQSLADHRVCVTPEIAGQGDQVGDARPRSTPIKARSAAMVVWVTRHPSSSSPTRLSGGNLTSVRKTSLKW